MWVKLQRERPSLAIQLLDKINDVLLKELEKAGPEKINVYIIGCI